MSRRILLYGATGFSGEALARALADLGGDLVLGGRSASRLKPLAESLGLQWRVFTAGPHHAADHALADIGALLNCAGPFGATARLLMRSCLRTRTDYFDLAGEWPVFETAMAMDAQARRAGIMLLPGAAFSIAASDCLLALTAAAYPDTTTLRLGISRPPRIGGGSIATIIGLNDTFVRVRRKGRIERLAAGHLAHAFDFGDGATDAVAVTWPDVFTATGTTGVETVETYAEGGLSARLAMRAGAVVAGTMIGAAWQRAMTASFADTVPPPINDKGIVLVAEARDRWRRPVTMRLRTGDGYAVTTAVASAAIRLWRDGVRIPGFTTPARLYGPKFILDYGGATLLPRAATHPDLSAAPPSETAP